MVMNDRRNTMAMNRIQFQLGLSLAEFLEQYGTEERCEQALDQARWPDGYRCELHKYALRYRECPRP
jgi:hypothetical protein